MVSSGSSQSFPWHDRPARPFPAKVWLEQRYPFNIVTSLAAHRAAPSADAKRPVWERRPFPAKVWLEARRAAPPSGD